MPSSPHSGSADAAAVKPTDRSAQRDIDEAVRLERHPGIFFRDGPAGRRAVLIGGPDVWEIVIAAKTATTSGEAPIDALSEGIGIPIERVRLAIGYYSDYPNEVDQHIAMVREEAERLERSLEREAERLG